MNPEQHIQPLDPGNQVQDSTGQNLIGLKDKEIWALFKKGHEGAFRHIYSTYFNDLYNYGFLFTKDVELIKDGIQDLFVDLRRSGESLSNTDHIKYYLLKSMRWKIGYMIRKSKRFFLSADLVDLFHINFVISHETILINSELHLEVKKKLADAINQLPRRQKEAIYYFYFENFTYEELVSIMKLGSTKAARNLIYKAVKSLRCSDSFQLSTFC